MNLEIDDLCVSFGERCVVSLPGLSITDAEAIGMAGESGSGKSITASAILGLAQRRGATVRGSIKLDGFELVGAPEAALRDIRGTRIAMIYQSPGSSFNPVLTFGGTFDRALRLHGLGRRAARSDAAARALEQVRLPATLLRRYPHQLSGGQAQRMAIALALALRADLLLADEPTSALDMTVQAEILDLLNQLRLSKRLAMLFISHDLSAIAAVSQRVLVLRQGIVAEYGSTEQVLNRPAHTYTRELVAAVPRLHFPLEREPDA